MPVQFRDYYETLGVPKTATEERFCALGPIAEAFLVGAAAIGNTHPTDDARLNPS